MRIAVSSDERTGVAAALVDALRERGHEPLLHGALSEEQRDDWAWASESAARDVAEGRAEQAVVCCWTGTGASIAANKVRGIRAALCADAATAEGARQWNDANVLALSLRDDLRGGARRDPRRLVRRAALARRRRRAPTSPTWGRSRADVRPWALGALLALVTAGIAFALLRAEGSGTGAENVGESGPERAATPEPTPRARPRARARAAPLQGRPRATPAAPTTTSRTRRRRSRWARAS